MIVFCGKKKRGELLSGSSPILYARHAHRIRTEWNLKVVRECEGYFCGQLTGKTVQFSLNVKKSFFFDFAEQNYDKNIDELFFGCIKNIIRFYIAK